MSFTELDFPHLREAVILIVDDVVFNVQALGSLLSEAGCQVVPATSAAQAERRLEALTPELILLDVMMPEVDGYTLCQRIKANPKTQHIPVIFLSALDEAMDKFRGFQAGGADYITKPFHGVEVLTRVNHHLKLARLQAALEREKEELLRMNQALSRAQRGTHGVFAALSTHLIGAVLDGRYRIDAQIGRGGFGVVYRATHLQLDRPVAVKVLRPPESEESEDTLQRFREEGAALCRVSHPNAVAVLDAGISPEGITYLVMELLDGHLLSEELRLGTPCALLRCLQIALPICSVLVEAHARGVMHRDIKPDNIFLHHTPQGAVVKVLDFGIAKLVGKDLRQPSARSTHAGKIIGTPVYMAPERIRGLAIDCRVDVYSIGMMLYEMLAGRLPFAESSTDLVDVLYQQLHSEIPALDKTNPAVPPPVSQAVMRALHKDGARRSTAAQLLSELRQLAEREFSSAALAEPLPIYPELRRSGPIAVVPGSPSVLFAPTLEQQAIADGSSAPK